MKGILTNVVSTPPVYNRLRVPSQRFKLCYLITLRAGKFASKMSVSS